MITTPIKLSVIMAFHNRGDLIAQTLDSVLNQTFRDFELICVDDGSTDNVPEVLDKYARQDPRMKIIYKKHTSAGDTRNVGYQHSTGKYIFFLDSDDLFEPNYFAQMVNTLEKENSDIVICKYDEFDHRTKQTICKYEFEHLDIKQPVVTFSISELYPNFFQIPFDVTWNKIFKREIMEQHHLRFRPVSGPDDISFTFLYLIKCRKITFINQSLIRYRVQDQRSIINSLSRPQIYCTELDILRNRFTKTEFESIKNSYFRKYLANTYFFLHRTNYRNGKKIFHHTEKIFRSINLRPDSLNLLFYYFCLKRNTFEVFYRSNIINHIFNRNILV